MDYSPPPPPVSIVHEYTVDIRKKWRRLPCFLEKSKKHLTKKKSRQLKKQRKIDRMFISAKQKKTYKEMIGPLNRAIAIFLETEKHFPEDESVKNLFNALLHHRLTVIKKLNLQEVERYYFSKPLHQVKTITHP